MGPFRLDLTVWALRRRARNRVDVWDGRYRRALLVAGEPATIEVTQDRHAGQPRLMVNVGMATEITDVRLSAVTSTVERLLGTGTDLDGFYDVADGDPRLARLKDRFRGVHPPLFPTLFEAQANAVANQQLSLEVGLELLNRLTDVYGVPSPGPDGPISTFPPAEAIANTTVAPLRDMGFSRRKAEYLIGLAQTVVSGDIDADELAAMGRAEATRDLMRLRGIGRWSAEYVLLRGLGRLDVFPGETWAPATSSSASSTSPTVPPTRRSCRSFGAGTPTRAWSTSTCSSTASPPAARSRTSDDDRGPVSPRACARLRERPPGRHGTGTTSLGRTWSGPPPIRVGLPQVIHERVAGEAHPIGRRVRCPSSIVHQVDHIDPTHQDQVIRKEPTVTSPPH